LIHLVVNDGQLGANWVPIGCQLGANRPPIGVRSYYDRVPIGVQFGSDHGQNGIFNRPYLANKSSFPIKSHTNPFSIHIRHTSVIGFD